MPGSVEKYLLEKIEKNHFIHMTLIDPENISPDQAAQTAGDSQKSGTAAIMIGGSTFVSQAHLDAVIKAIKQFTSIPTILFPNNVSSISQYADAIWFMSLLNSMDPYFVIGAQILGAPLVRRFRLEAISMGYITVGEGGTASIIGKAIPVPYDKPELAAAHALAAKYLGMHFIYLEGGSGVRNPVPPEMIRVVKSVIDIPLVVGGGIRTKEQATNAALAGADIIVTGNLTESAGASRQISEIVNGLRTANP